MRYKNSTIGKNMYIAKEPDVQCHEVIRKIKIVELEGNMSIGAMVRTGCIEFQRSKYRGFSY